MHTSIIHAVVDLLPSSLPPQKKPPGTQSTVHHGSKSSFAFTSPHNSGTARSFDPANGTTSRMPTKIGVAEATTTVSIAPLILLSACDHYGRSAKGTRKRVVGVLLGQITPSSVRVSNSFAGESEKLHIGSPTADFARTVPFEEDDKDPSVWFLDHTYIESMNLMFKQVNAREKLIGWYHSGPKLRASDLEINELFKRYTPNPVLVIIDVHPKEVGVPTDAYFAVEEIKDVCLPSLTISQSTNQISLHQAYLPLHYCLPRTGADSFSA